MLKYITKFAMDILPSVAATIIGAYIVNHYIVSRPDTPAAAVASSVDPKAEAKTDVKARCETVRQRRRRPPAAGGHRQGHL